MQLVWVLVEARMCGSDLIVVCVVGCLFVVGSMVGVGWCSAFLVFVWCGLFLCG